MNLLALRNSSSLELLKTEIKFYHSPPPFFWVKLIPLHHTSYFQSYDYFHQIPYDDIYIFSSRYSEYIFKQTQWMSQPELFQSFSTEELSKCFVPKYLNLTGSCPKLENKMWKERLYTRDFINGRDFLLEFIISLFVIPTLLPGFVMYAQMKIERAHTFGPLTSTTFGKLLSTFAFCVIVFFPPAVQKGNWRCFSPSNSDPGKNPASENACVLWGEEFQGSKGGTRNWTMALKPWNSFETL